nr:hypothetical protein [Tanacetum cinerariifolium]
MSDSDELGVTYTDISSPFEELSYIGSPRADDHEHLMLPEMLEDPYVEVALQAPPSPDYIPGPEEPEQAPPSPDYIPGPEHADDEIVVEDQLYAEDASPIAQSPEEDRPKVTLPPQKRLAIILGPRYEVGESSSAAAARPAGGRRAAYGFVTTVDREIMHDLEREVGYGITGSWDEIVETLQGAPVSTDTELGGYVREFETRVRQDTDEIYMRLDDEQTERQLLAGRLNMLFRDRRAHAYTRHLMETEARMSREAWVRATDAGDLVHGEVMSLRTIVLGASEDVTDFLFLKLSLRCSTLRTSVVSIFRGYTVNTLIGLKAVVCSLRAFFHLEEILGPKYLLKGQLFLWCESR